MPIYGIRTSSNNMTTSLCGTLKFSRYRVLGKIQIAEPGTGCLEKRGYIHEHFVRDRIVIPQNFSFKENYDGSIGKATLIGKATP